MAFRQMCLALQQSAHYMLPESHCGTAQLRGAGVTEGKRLAFPRCRLRAIVRSACGMPVVGKQLVDAAVQVGRQAGQHVIEVGPRIVPVELG